jgi:hypothetical protein
MRCNASKVIGTGRPAWSKPSIIPAYRGSGLGFGVSTVPDDPSLIRSVADAAYRQLDAPARLGVDIYQADRDQAIPDGIVGGDAIRVRFEITDRIELGSAESEWIYHAERILGREAASSLHGALQRCLILRSEQTGEEASPEA